MSLSYIISDIENHDSLCWIAEEGEPTVMNPVTHGLIFYTMWVGMSEIKEGNWQEFYTRVHMYEQCNGPVLVLPEEDGCKLVKTKFKPEWIREHIGLRTNASRMTKAQFVKGLVESMERDAENMIYPLVAVNA